MKLFVCIFGTPKKVRRASFIVAVTMGTAVVVFGAPMLSFFVVSAIGGALVAKTHDWMWRHPDDG